MSLRHKIRWLLWYTGPYDFTAHLEALEQHYMNTTSTWQ
jgi:hypothetical protein